MLLSRTRILVACGGLFVLAGTGALFAHHPSGVGTRALPGGRSLRPAPQILLDAAYYKGERQNRHRLIATTAVELPVYSDLLALSVEAPYTYFRQNDRGDAGRHGRPRMGLRLRAPLERLGDDLSNWLMVLDGDYAAPAGRDRNVFVDEPFADARAGLTFGYADESFLFLLRGGGIFPASDLPFRGIDELSAAPWRPAPELIRGETHELKKTTEWQARLGIRRDGILFFVGGLHRTPYAGVVIERRFASLPLARTIVALALDEERPDLTLTTFDLARPEPPAVYGQVETGLAFDPAPGWTVAFSYGYPLFRGAPLSVLEQFVYLAGNEIPPDQREFRLHDEVYTFSISRSFQP